MNSLYHFSFSQGSFLHNALCVCTEGLVMRDLCVCLFSPLLRLLLVYSSLFESNDVSSVAVTPGAFCSGCFSTSVWLVRLCLGLIKAAIIVQSVTVGTKCHLQWGLFFLCRGETETPNNGHLFGEKARASLIVIDAGVAFRWHSFFLFCICFSFTFESIPVITCELEGHSWSHSRTQVFLN